MALTPLTAAQITELANIINYLRAPGADEVPVAGGSFDATAIERLAVLAAANGFKANPNNPAAGATTGAFKDAARARPVTTLLLWLYAQVAAGAAPSPLYP